MISIQKWAALLALPTAAVILAAAPGTASAQDGPDFLFRSPGATLSVRAGYVLPAEKGEIFDFIKDSLTVDGFRGFLVAGDLSVRIQERFDVSVGLGYSRVEQRSEYRNWVDLDDLPIEQSTLISRMPVTFGLKYYFKDRGRSVGRFVWIPEQWTPYVGFAGGWTRYKFEQDGDFIDYETLDIFPDEFDIDGWAPTWSLLTGLDWTLNPRVALRGEARYSWSEGDLGSRFRGLPLDLDGFDMSFGFAFRL